MVLIDDFESQFRRADKPVFDLEEHTTDRVLLLLDAEESECKAYQEPLETFLSACWRESGKPGEWNVLNFGPSEDVARLLERTEAFAPDLIITRRHLFKSSERPLESLGLYVDVLAQNTSTPVLLLPRLSVEEFARQCQNTSDVMILSDNLSHDNHLVNFGVHFTQNEGCLYLTDIEDGAAFERYMSVIDKIPLIDSTLAREEIDKQLRKEVLEFSKQCAEKIKVARPDIRVESVFRYGSSIDDFKSLLQDHKIDLLIFNTKDESQMAMHGMAYPIAVEFGNMPLLML